MALRVRCGLTPAPLDFVLTSGGHNAGIVSEPGHPRRRYRSLARPAGGPTLTPDEWLQAAPAHDGSWWPAWASWLAGLSGKPQAARPGRAAPRYPVLADAPGAYVLEKEE